MAVYGLAQLTIENREQHQRYVAGFVEVLLPFGGRLLAADEAPEVLEDSWPFDKVVLLSFPDEVAFRAWSTSDAYQTLSKDRVAAVRGPVLLVRGIPQASKQSTS